MALSSGARARLLLASLRVRLGLLVCLTVIPAFAVVLLNMHLDAVSALEEEAHDDAERAVDLVALEHRRAIEGAQQLAERLASLEPVKGRDGTGCSHLIRTLGPALPGGARIAVADARGDIFCSAVPGVDTVNVADRPYFRSAIAERRLVMGGFTVSRVSGKPVLALAYPVLGGGGEPAAVVIVGVDLGWLQGRAAELRLRDGSRVLVLDRQGVVLVRHPDPEAWVGKSLRDTQVAGAALAAGGPGRLRGRGPDGVERFYAFTPVLAADQASGVVVLAGIPTAAVLGPARAALWRHLSVLGVVALVALAAMWLGGERMIVRPARALRDAAKRLSDGQLDARTGVAHDAGELGRVARAFDHMAGKLAERTERLQAQVALEQALGEAERASRAKIEFLARMSHELRTPLNAILGFGQLLEMSVTEKDDRESVEQVLRAGRHLLALVNEVLDLSRAETGGLALSLEPVDVDEAVAATLELARPLAEGRRILCRRARASPAGSHVRADNQRLRQVLFNLVANGIKHNVEGGSVEVGWERAEEGWLRIAVTDDGPGIAPELQSRLFAPFDRLGAEVRGTEGAGLGLALSRRLVEAMGGRIAVRSQPGQGSAFWVELPETQMPAEREAARIPPSGTRR